VLQLLVTAKPIIFTLTMEEISFSEMSVVTRATRVHFPEDDILEDTDFRWQLSNDLILMMDYH
jgi:hypothetical protein